MKIYLADTWIFACYILPEIQKEENPYKPDMLFSYYYIEKNPRILSVLPYVNALLIDSGAFTFRQNNKNNINWDEYLERYAAFINKYNIDKFFELDIDVLVGYEEVKRLRRKLENLTGKKCIPVWHLNRGKDEFLKMCDEYDYVALGGIAGANKHSLIVKKYIELFPWFIKEAHKRGTKIHGLGFTDFSKLQNYHFDSVDSTSWVSGGRFGMVYVFDGKNMKVVRHDDRRVKNVKDVSCHNYKEWCKFQKYARNML